MKHLLKPTLVLSVCTLLGQIVSFIVNVISAKIFGANAEMDAYLAAQTVPGFITVVLLGGLGYVFIPSFVEHRSKGSEQDAWRIANSLTAIYVALLSLLAIAGIVFAGPIIRLTAPGLSAESMRLAVKLSYIVWPSTIFSGLLAILTSLYQAYERFIYQAVVTLLCGVLYILILLIFGDKENGIYVLSWGFLISSAVNVLLLVRILGKQKKIQFSFREKAVFTLFSLQVPIVLAAACSNATKLFDRYFASELATGTISYLSYADKIKIAVAAVLGGGISVTLFPLMAKNFTNNNKEELKKNIAFGLNITGVIVLPVIMAGSVLSAPIVQLLFQRGEFGDTETFHVSRLLPWFLLSVIGATMGNVTARAFYVLKKTKIIAVIGVLEVLLYMIYMPLLVKFMHDVGIAVSMMLLWNVTLIVQFFVLDQKFGLINRAEVFTGLFKVACASVIPAVILKLLLPFAGANQLIIFTGGVIFFVVYTLLLYVFRVKEFRAIMNLLKLSKKIRTK